MPRIFARTPLASPDMGSSPMMGSGSVSGPAPMANIAMGGMNGNGASGMKSSPVTYIPPLCDGACGTLPRSQQGVMGMLRREMMEMVGMMPGMGWAAMRQCMGMRMGMGMGMSIGDVRDVMMHGMLACMEMGMMMAGLPICLMMPGMVSMMWMACCALVVIGMCRMINGREQMCQCSEGAGQEVEDEKWMFVGGMGMSSRRCHRVTLPMMSRLFNRPMTCICMPTYGLPFDMVMMMLQRCLAMPTQAHRNLYAQMRCALLDDSMHRCVVLCHNHSATTVSHVVSQLCADLPMEKLRKLEIYTFGSAAPEFMMPLGESNLEMDAPLNPSQQQHPADMMSSPSSSSADRKTIHIEHFAMAHDPFAQAGILRSVRRDMDGRTCGGVFIMTPSPAPAKQQSSRQMMTMNHMMTGTTMEDYLCALFPSQMMSLMTPSSSSSSTSPPQATATPRSMLEHTMHIDRDCAEKREITAMTNYHAASSHSHGRTGGKGAKRLSWTGLAAASSSGNGNGSAQKGMNGVSAGMMGLEMARKGCKDCNGHKGREVSWLVRYVGGMGMGMGIGVMNGSMGMEGKGGAPGMEMGMGRERREGSAQ
ncbi:hypothetical protein B0T16DRAFT_417260 [Cercophora newfieldiana]|uniref:Uncharacterized protein n=1 Tax=Cercophora newfieldiana TaxID=92897 RepID=A0AA39Y1B2_9PEZI|nr:hypothetical protein B0T16DRAFT_417260 [Cercophora newfieldiana]